MTMPHIESTGPILCACAACEQEHAAKAGVSSVVEAITELVAIDQRYSEHRPRETDSRQRSYLHIWLRRHGYKQDWDEEGNMVACPKDHKEKEYYIYPN